MALTFPLYRGGDSLASAMSEEAVKLMNQADHARREHRLADAERDLSEAVGRCRGDGARRELAQALKKLAQIKRDSGQGDAARPLYEEAVAIYREEGGALELAHAIRHLGDVHRHEGHAKLAEDCYLEALALYRNQQGTPPLDLANAIRPLAILKDDAGEVEEAKRLWEEARGLYAGVNVEAGVAESSARLARLGQRRESAE
jgi:tetratricopeptide (TPR) repeat protein